MAGKLSIREHSAIYTATGSINGELIKYWEEAHIDLEGHGGGGTQENTLF